MPDTVLQVNLVRAELQQGSRSGSKPELTTLIQPIRVVDLRVDVGVGLGFSMLQAKQQLFRRLRVKTNDHPRLNE